MCITIMRLVTKQSGRFTYLYAIKGYRTDDGKSTTKVVKKFGTVEELREKLNGEDPIEWAKAQVARMTEQENEESKKVVIECNPKALISKGEQRSYNGGYLFLQKIYYELGLDYICKKIAKKHKMVQYDLSGILSLLATEFNEIQADVYKRSLKLGKRNTTVVYYDLTNYFFEWEEEGGLVQYGHCPKAAHGLCATKSEKITRPQIGPTAL